ncbi:hypothetical protein HDU67_001746 [Dinochytrium kinnereticum]|nr:hypothetical protein HDU67_001746 [Dinochytrium kinnereticum]
MPSKPRQTLKRASPAEMGVSRAAKGGKETNKYRKPPGLDPLGHSLEVFAPDTPTRTSVLAFRRLLGVEDTQNVAVSLLRILRDFLANPALVSAEHEGRTEECLEFMGKVVTSGHVPRGVCNDEVLVALVDLLVKSDVVSVCRKICEILKWLLSKQQFDALIPDSGAVVPRLPIAEMRRQATFQTSFLMFSLDIELQQSLVEILYRIAPRAEKQRIDFASTHQIPITFSRITLENYADEVRDFLGTLNESNEAGKRWPKSYRVSAVSYKTGRKDADCLLCECQLTTSFWLDFSKSSVSVHFELKGEPIIVEIEYVKIDTFEVDYNSLCLQLKKPLLVFNITGSKPPYVISLKWKPKNFPAGGPGSIRTIMKLNGIQELTKTSSFDGVTAKVSIPSSRRTFSMLSIQPEVVAEEPRHPEGQAIVTENPTVRFQILLSPSNTKNNEQVSSPELPAEVHESTNVRTPTEHDPTPDAMGSEPTNHRFQRAAESDDHTTKPIKRNPLPRHGDAPQKKRGRPPRSTREKSSTKTRRDREPSEVSDHEAQEDRESLGKDEAREIREAREAWAVREARAAREESFAFAVGAGDPPPAVDARNESVLLNELGVGDERLDSVESFVMPNDAAEDEATPAPVAFHHSRIDELEKEPLVETADSKFCDDTRHAQVLAGVDDMFSGMKTAFINSILEKRARVVEEGDLALRKRFRKHLEVFNGSMHERALTIQRGSNLGVLEHAQELLRKHETHCRKSIADLETLTDEDFA